MMLLKEDINAEELNLYTKSRPAARTLNELRNRNYSPDLLLNEAIIYYERVLAHQEKIIQCYIDKFGIHHDFI